MRKLIALLIFFAPFFLPTVSLAQVQATVEVYALAGEVQYQASNASSWRAIAKGEKLPASGMVRVGEKSRLGLRFPDGRLVRLRENSKLDLTASKDKPDEDLTLVEGALHLFNRLGKARYTVKTPQVSAAIRGTEFVVISENDESTFTVYDGEVLLGDGPQPLRLAQGESGAARKGEAPRKLLTVNPVDQVQWALYFPAIFTDEEQSQIASSGSPALKEAYSLALQSKYSEALAKLSSPTNDQEKLVAASLQLQLGAPEGALLLLDTITAPVESDAAKALKGIVALSKNERSTAQDLYNATSSGSPQQYLLGSLLKSSTGDIEGALDHIEAALAKYPEEPVFLARKAELLLGMGYTKRALQTAKDAYKRRPSDAYITTILGFAYLARKDVDSAAQSFESALYANPSFPEAHFGQALSLIGQGQLAEGRAQLEQTVHLDTNRSLYRSYLGKAFFEELNEDAADKEYSLAIERDENDPTPYLYRAFNRLSKNNVVGALNDVEDSIARNDARAVFRSSSLLDQDLSVRTTSLSEVFRQLGFRDIARIEAMKSIQRDYSNFAAHRLLGEVLEGDFYSDAKFSQRLVSELLSPLSFNVFQSFNGFNAEPSFGDYSALFDRPGNRSEVNFTGTNVDDEYQGSAITSGAVDKIGYLATYGYRTLGPSEIQEHNARLALQYQPTIDHRFFVEGELSTLDDEFTEDQTDLFDVTGAIGSYHRLTEQTELISRFEYFGRERETESPLVFGGATQDVILASDSVLFPEFEIDLDQQTDEDIDTVRGNIQVIHSESFGSLVSGVEYIYANGDGDEESIITGDSVGFFSGLSPNRNSFGDYDTNTVSAYSYATGYLAEWLNVTAGLSYRRVELPAFGTIAPYTSGERDIDQFSPKFGFTITPDDYWTIRGAYFQNLGASSVDDIGTIEPVLVGSFVQLLGDLPGVESETYGIGIDYRQPKQFYTGIEYSYRDLERDDVEVLSNFVTDSASLTDTLSFSTSVTNENETENLIRAYLYGIISEQFTTLLEYRRDDLEAKDIDEDNETDRIRMGARYFSPQYWFALADIDWYHQDRNGVLGFDNGSEDFWVVNAGVGYRFPKRHGQVRLQAVNLLDQSFDYASRDRFTDPPSGIGFLADFSYNF